MCNKDLHPIQIKNFLLQGNYSLLIIIDAHILAETTFRIHKENVK